MREKTKGTPRKRPYDVKRKLERAAKKVRPKICGMFYSVVDGKTEYCLLGAYNKVHGEDICNLSKAASRLGLSVAEVWAITRGFDGQPVYGYEPWYKIGADFREEYSPRQM